MGARSTLSPCGRGCRARARRVRGCPHHEPMRTECRTPRSASCARTASRRKPARSRTDPKNFPPPRGGGGRGGGRGPKAAHAARPSVALTPPENVPILGAVVRSWPAGRFVAPLAMGGRRLPWTRVRGTRCLKSCIGRDAPVPPGAAAARSPPSSGSRRALAGHPGKPLIQRRFPPAATCLFATFACRFPAAQGLHRSFFPSRRRCRRTGGSLGAGRRGASGAAIGKGGFETRPYDPLQSPMSR